MKSKDISLDSGSSPSVDEADGDTEDTLSTIVDSNDSPVHAEAQTKYAAAKPGLGDEPAEDPIASPLTESTPALTPLLQQSRAYSTSRLTSLCAYPETRLSALSEDVKALLRYHIEKLYYYHYAFRSDRGDFFKTTLLEIAINDENEALLYAVVAFAEYHRTFAVADSGITNFLTYYNKSIGLLQQSLKHPNTTTLLTILQLATIEVGDLALCSSFQIHAESCAGVSWRLGHLDRASKGLSPAHRGSVHATDSLAERNAASNHKMVHSIRIVLWANVRGRG